MNMHTYIYTQWCRCLSNLRSSSTFEKNCGPAALSEVFEKLSMWSFFGSEIYYGPQRGTITEGPANDLIGMPRAAASDGICHNAALDAVQETRRWVSGA